MKAKTLIGIIVMFFLAGSVIAVTQQDASDSQGYADNYIYENWTATGYTNGLEWQVKHGGLATYNISISTSHQCWDATTFQTRFYSTEPQSGSGNIESHPECYNGTAWVTVGSTDSSTDTAGSHATETTPSNAYDDDYATYVCWWNFIIAGGTNWYTTCSQTEHRIYEASVFWNDAAGPSDTCTYSSGDWIIECSDACNITATVDLNGNSVTFNGTGTVQINGTVTNFTNSIAQNGCNVVVFDGGILG